MRSMRIVHFAQIWPVGVLACILHKARAYEVANLCKSTEVYRKFDFTSVCVAEGRFVIMNTI